MTLEQALQRLKDMGYEGEPTRAVLSQVMQKPYNPLAGLGEIEAAQTDSQVLDDLTRLEIEAVNNNVPKQILNKFKTLVGVALKTI